MFLTSRRVIIVVFVSVVALLVLAPDVQAAVTGACSNCHTMHNSQDGSVLDATVNDTLLVSSCIGCHSSSGSETIVNFGPTRIPIVFNTTGYPTKPLAGGNFYDVAAAGGNIDSHGHNVYGISNQDSDLDHAPLDLWGGGCTNSCHASLAMPKSSMTDTQIDGCKICHQKYKHHGTDIAEGSMETEESGWYRFLGGHDARYGGGIVMLTSYVAGIEDADWEQDPTLGHNRYQGAVTNHNDNVLLQTTHSISAFCTGCHAQAHMNTEDAASGVWLRHPTMIRLPTTGEFADYNPETDYDASVPVGWLDPTTPTRSDAVVTCLSCHLVHGSQYPDMLRWDYSAMTAGGGDNETGCFKCHSSKDS